MFNMFNLSENVHTVPKNHWFEMISTNNINNLLSALWWSSSSGWWWWWQWQWWGGGGNLRPLPSAEVTCSCGGGAAAHSPKNVAPRDHHDDNDDDDDDNDDDDNFDNGKLRHICSEGERSLVFLIRFQKSEIGEISEMIRTKRCCFLTFLLVVDRNIWQFWRYSTFEALPIS